jgi:hypothetical protein
VSYLRREWHGFKLWWVLVRGWRWPKLPWMSYPPPREGGVFPIELGWGASERDD